MGGMSVPVLLPKSVVALACLTSGGPSGRSECAPPTSVVAPVPGHCHQGPAPSTLGAASRPTSSTPPKQTGPCNTTRKAPPSIQQPSPTAHRAAGNLLFWECLRKTTLCYQNFSPRVQFLSPGVPFHVRLRAHIIKICQRSFGPSDLAEGSLGG